tara:strand:- start:1332 stop:2990 length:1659 start_codon:yes stop_codon:yes gene_type:complete
MAFPFRKRKRRPDNRRNTQNPFGTANPATFAEVHKAGLFRKTDTAIYCGEFWGRSLWYDGEGGVLLVAGARSGKLRDIISYTICKGVCDGRNIVILDPKGELAAISRNQVLGNSRAKKVITFNPYGLHGLPRHTFNPSGLLKWSSPTLIPDLKLFLENWIGKSGSPNAEYFELNARRWAEAFCLTLIKRDGVLQLPEFYRVISLISGGGKAWIDFAYQMHTSGIDLSHDVEEEIAAMREDRSGGFQGIIGELQKSVACLSDPLLAKAVSGPFDFGLEELCDQDALTQLYLMVPPEFLELWGPVLRSIFTACMIEKSRKPQAPRQLWLLDECGQIGKSSLIPKMFTYGAGIGIQPFAVFQSFKQMDALGPGAAQLIQSSAALQMYFATRDLDSAKMVSDILGTQTLRVDDQLTQSRARLKRDTLVSGIMGGADPFQLATQLIQIRTETRHKRLYARKLETVDEVLRADHDRIFIICDGLPNVIIGNRRSYLRCPWMAGSYLANPYHPPLDSVMVRTRWGQRRRTIITEAVPEEYADLPQYAHGLWSYVEGFKP